MMVINSFLLMSEIGGAPQLVCKARKIEASISRGNAIVPSRTLA